MISCIYLWLKHANNYLFCIIHSQLTDDSVIIPIWQMIMSDSLMENPESSIKKREWDSTFCLSQRSPDHHLLDIWRPSRNWELTVSHISNIVATWVLTPQSLSLKKLVMQMRSFVVHGSGVRVKGLWFLLPLYLHSAFIWDSVVKCFSNINLEVKIRGQKMVRK